MGTDDGGQYVRDYGYVKGAESGRGVETGSGSHSETSENENIWRGCVRGPREGCEKMVGEIIRIQK